MHLRKVGSVQGCNCLVRRPAFPVIGIGRVIAKCFILDKMPYDVDPKTVDAFPHPEAKHIAHRINDFRISPIQIWLGPKKGVVVVLA